MNDNVLPPEILEELQKAYNKTIPEKIALLEHLVQELHQNVSLDTLKALRLHVHKMAGSLGTYGYFEASLLCKEWDGKLAKMIDLFPEQENSLFARLDLFLVEIKKKLVAYG